MEAQRWERGRGSGQVGESCVLRSGGRWSQIRQGLVGPAGDSALTPSEAEPQMSSDPLGVRRPRLAACREQVVGAGPGRPERRLPSRPGRTGTGGERGGRPLHGLEKDRKPGQPEGCGGPLQGFVLVRPSSSPGLPCFVSPQPSCYGTRARCPHGCRM